MTRTPISLAVLVLLGLGAPAALPAASNADGTVFMEHERRTMAVFDSSAPSSVFVAQARVYPESSVEEVERG